MVMGSTLGRADAGTREGLILVLTPPPIEDARCGGGAGRLPARPSRRCAAPGRGPAGRRPPPHAGPAARGAGGARRSRHHLVHVARAGARRAGLAGRAGGAGAGAAPVARGARAHDPARARRAGAAAPGAEGDRLAGAAAPDRKPEPDAGVPARPPLRLPRLQPCRRRPVRRDRARAAGGAQPPVARVHASGLARAVPRLGAERAPPARPLPRGLRRAGRRPGVREPPAAAARRQRRVPRVVAAPRGGRQRRGAQGDRPSRRRAPRVRACGVPARRDERAAARALLAVGGHRHGGEARELLAEGGAQALEQQPAGG